MAHVLASVVGYARGAHRLHGLVEDLGCDAAGPDEFQGPVLSLEDGLVIGGELPVRLTEGEGAGHVRQVAFVEAPHVEADHVPLAEPVLGHVGHSQGRAPAEAYVVHVRFRAALHLAQVEGEAHLRLRHALARLVGGLVDGVLGDPHRLGHAPDLAGALDHADLPEDRRPGRQFQLREPLPEPLRQGRVQAPFVVADTASVETGVLQRPHDALEEVPDRLQFYAQLPDAPFSPGERRLAVDHAVEGPVGDDPRGRDRVHQVVHLGPRDHDPRRGHRVRPDDGRNVLTAPHPAQVEDVGNVAGGEQPVKAPLRQHALRPRLVDPHVGTPAKGKGWKRNIGEPNRVCQTGSRKRLEPVRKVPEVCACLCLRTPTPSFPPPLP